MLCASFKSLIGGFLLSAVAASLAGAQTSHREALDALLNDLLVADADSVQMLERQIVEEWSKSGSPTIDLLLRRGREALEAGDVEMAVNHLTAAINHAPYFAHAYNLRAVAYYQLEQFGPAMADIQKAIALEPQHFGALGGFAAILNEIDEPEKALEVYQRILEIHPNHESALQSVEALEKQLAGRPL